VSAPEYVNNLLFKDCDRCVFNMLNPRIWGSGCSHPHNVGRPIVHNPLWLAARDGDTNRVLHLMRDGADVNEYDRHVDAPYPLWAACLGSHPDTAQALIDHGAVVDSLNENDSTPMLRYGFNQDLLKMFMENGANIHVKNRHGVTIVGHVVDSNNIEALVDLHERGFDLSQEVGNYGNTCLHLAAADNKVEMIIILLDLGVDINIVNNRGETALQVATRRNNHEVIGLIEMEELRREQILILQERRLAVAMGLHPVRGLDSRISYIGDDAASIVMRMMDK
jgi:ankyrin repeat protein